MSIVILFILILFFVHSYYYDLATSDSKKSTVFFSLFRRIFSFRYMLPLSIDGKDSQLMAKYKKIANYSLYAAYCLFVIAMAYIAIF
jgi:hypothetical protein